MKTYIVDYMKYTDEGEYIKTYRTVKAKNEKEVIRLLQGKNIDRILDIYEADEE